MSIKLRSARDSSALPMPLDLGTQQAQGVTIDNYSGYWLQVGSGPLFVPPYTLGWANNFYGQSASSVEVRKNTPSSFVLNPTSGQEGAIVAALYEEAITPNAGLPLLRDRPLDNLFVTVNGTAAGAVALGGGTLRGGGTILHVAMSGIVTGGTIGHAQISVSDGTTSFIIAVLELSNLGVSDYGQRLDLVPADLDPDVPTWSVILTMTNQVGVNAFYMRALVITQS